MKIKTAEKNIELDHLLSRLKHFRVITIHLEKLARNYNFMLLLFYLFI
jgi:hypothetical protein